jgi:4-hydroxy-3-polyprenylbenzoate decarboxylase
MTGALVSSYKRLATALGLDPASSIRALQDYYLEKMATPGIKPVLVDKAAAPCKQNILLGDDADLFKLPAPMIYDGQGGRYIGTWHAVITEDPDTREPNWGTYRQMAWDGKTIAAMIFPFSGAGKVFHSKYVPKNQPMPFATAIGMEPICHMSAVTATDIPEPEYAGRFRGEPVELVKCETSDLQVPAYAEIVIEGELVPGVSLEEGPFGEYSGHSTGLRSSGMENGKIVCRVKAITHRDNPIFTLSPLGYPVDETHLIFSFTMASEARMFLQREKLPIIDVFIPPQAASNCLAVSVEHTSSIIPHRIAHTCWNNLGPWCPPHIVVVDADIDVFDLKDVFFAMMQRCHPIRGIRTDTWPVFPQPICSFSSPAERREGPLARALYDCTFPPEWSKEVDRPFPVRFTTVYPKEIQERVLRNWHKYGFKE